MDRDFFEKLIAYYKCRIEDDERYGKRIEDEERDAYRVIKALSNSKNQITIKNMGDLARLLNVAKQLTIDGSRNIYEDFCSIPQVETIINNMTSRKPEQMQAIKDYDFSDWEPNDTPLEQEYKQVERFRNANMDEIYNGILSKASKIINEGRPIQIKTTAETIQELNEKEKSILAISKIIMRLNGFLPDSELQFENGRVILNYTEAEKFFSSDILKKKEQTMGMTPAQVKEKKEKDAVQRATAVWEAKKKSEEEKVKSHNEALARWKRKGEEKGESSQRKQENGNKRGMGMSR